MWTAVKTKKYGVAIYNWKGDVRYGLPLEIGETVQILEENSGWFRGFSTKNRSIKGIFPASYIYLKPCRVDSEGLFESVIPVEDPVLREVTQVLREWGNIWKNLYVLDKDDYKFRIVGKVMRELLEWRRQLLSGTLTQDQTRELKVNITNKIDWGNRKLGLDLVPRVDCQMVDSNGMSAVELYQVHVASCESTQSASAGRFGTIRSSSKNKKVQLNHHLYLCVRDVGYAFHEEIGIYLSLYDCNTCKPITDRFLIQLPKQGYSNYIEKINNCTIFTDLGNGDLHKEFCLVAHVIRMGRMVYSESGRKSGTNLVQQNFKRPVGVAVLPLAGTFDPDKVSSEEMEFTFKVYQCEEKDFSQLHEFIIKKQTNKFSLLPCQPNYGLIVALKLLHGELSQLREELPIYFKNISLTKKLGFPDIILPGDVRNDLYLTLDKGEFERGGKSTSKNIEITVCVLDGEGNILENCLWGACGMEPSSEYRSVIIYHNNNPHWSETIRIAIPLDKSDSHVRFEFRHCSAREKQDNKKLFGFSFARLLDSDGATLRDSVHELYIYKCEDRSKLNHDIYLKLPSCLKEEANFKGTGFTRSPKEVFVVNSLLCSTKLTQNVDLLSLLKWKEHPDRIGETLNKMISLGGEEVVKFLQDVLDSLFAIFSTEDGNSTPHSGQVFHVLVSIFSCLEDGKFEHFKPVIDTYIKGHFAAALVYKGLLSSVQHCADFVQSSGSREPLQKCFRSLEFVFKFIIQSRLLFARATDGQYEETFRKDLFMLFKSLNSMLAKSNAHILNTQVAMLHGIAAVFEQLTQVVPTVEVTRLASAMLESLPTRDPSPQLTQAKLTAIKNLVTSQLFIDDESRNILLTTCCRHLRLHLAHRDELKLCAEILTEIISYLYKQRQAQSQGKVNNCIHLDIEILALNILDILIHALLIIFERPGAVLGPLVACLIGLLQLMDEYHYKRLWEEHGERKALKDLLSRVFFVFKDLVMTDVFPSDWLVMKMQVNQILRESLQEFAQPLVFKFLEPASSPPQFDSDIWSCYFNLAVAYLTQPCLQLETFSQVKREMIVEKYGDMRVLMGFQILSMWSNLGEHKIHFIQSMVGPFLEVTLVPESELRKATLHIFYDMIQVEQQCYGNFKTVENELIDKLDILISENKGDDEYRQLFNTMFAHQLVAKKKFPIRAQCNIILNHNYIMNDILYLLLTCQREHLSALLLDKVQTEEPLWKDSGKAFITSVTRLLERLLDYRSVIQGDENRDKRMSCTVNLLNFYKNEINRKEMYLRYIYKLHDLHLSAENYLEAGFTMKLYADQLNWTTRHLPADQKFPAQLEWQRKEQLYEQIIRYFDRGKAWEKGIPMCKELTVLYETKVFDYNKLSAILQTQSRFYENILQQLRPEPEYFRVGFYGLSFPLFVRNKVFIYRGLEYERIGAFTQRLQTEFPSAQILTKNTPPDDTIVNAEGQFIQICNVKPLNENHVSFMGLCEAPEKIVSYYEVNDVTRFQLDRPTHRSPVDKENEFKSLWIERTILTISSPLPGILRWFEVTRKSVECIPPVQFACETMDTMNRELRQLIQLYTAEPNRNINPFSMRLQGIIDANVMGGPSKYQQAFFTNQFAEQHPNYLPWVHRLKALLIEQMQVLENALILHGQLCPSGVQPLHKRLQERFLQLRQGLRDISGATGKSIINTPLPPVPNELRKSAPYDNRLPNSFSASVSDDYLYDDGVYSHPTESGENVTPPLPQRKSSSSQSEDFQLQQRPPVRPTHQRSLSKPLSPRAARHAIAAASVQACDDSVTAIAASPLRNSWSDETSCLRDRDNAPPLPPRGLTPDKRGGYLDGHLPSVPPKRPLSQKSANSLFYADLVTTSDIHNASGDEPLIRQHSLSSSSNGDCKDSGDVLRDSGCFPDGPRHENSFSSASNFNNLSYEDYELKKRGTKMVVATASAGIETLNISFNGDGDNVSDEEDVKPLNTEVRPLTPPPIPPKSVVTVTAERRDSLETANSPPMDTMENYSVPKLHNPK